jgi:hypothetical protein
LIHEVKGTLLVKAFNDVSEGSNAIFCISLDSNTSVSGTNVTLGLTPGSASSSSDFGPTYAEAYYYDGSNNKQTLTISGNLVTLPQNVTVFFVSVPTTDDSPKVYEGPETFSLSASITVEGTPISNSDAATIRDDGNGSVFNADGTANNSATPDNDLSVSVTGYGPVNEASTYAMFKVDASSGDALNLSVINGTATLVTPMIEFSLDGTTWTLFNASATGGFPTVPAGAGNLGTVYVRVTITSESDSMYEGSESFSLRATSRANSSISDTESTSIVDDGTGLKYTGDFTSGSPDTNATSLDNDLSVSVTSYSPVNEGSTWAMFKVVAAAGDNPQPKPWGEGGQAGLGRLGLSALSALANFRLTRSQRRGSGIGPLVFSFGAQPMEFSLICLVLQVFQWLETRLSRTQRSGTRTRTRTRTRRAGNEYEYHFIEYEYDKRQYAQLQSRWLRISPSSPPPLLPSQSPGEKGSQAGTDPDFRR